MVAYGSCDRQCQLLERYPTGVKSMASERHKKDLKEKDLLAKAAPKKQKLHRDTDPDGGSSCHPLPLELPQSTTSRTWGDLNQRVSTLEDTGDTREEELDYFKKEVLDMWDQNIELQDHHSRPDEETRSHLMDLLPNQHRRQ
ncbi:hypothetical protein NDU88_002335 [Pleurodeles waltl]|uniref:Uncharacterized protein n=1 Tax=Pleurodeles waltl TaxID=8319 RepID=A0AAV7RBM9_PLEWA|nr:hypothetical protein NDU88_002335 [Pleurodeles waltl]